MGHIEDLVDMGAFKRERDEAREEVRDCRARIGFLSGTLMAFEMWMTSAMEDDLARSGEKIGEMRDYIRLVLRDQEGEVSDPPKSWQERLAWARDFWLRSASEGGH